MPETPDQDNILSLAIDGLAGDARDAFAFAGRSGYRGVSASADHREINPRDLSGSGRRHLKRILANQGLSLVSLRVPMGAAGLGDANTLDDRLALLRETFEMARDLGAASVAIFAGGRDALASDAIHGAAQTIAELADRYGARAVLSGEPAADVAGLVRGMDNPGIRADIDTLRLLAESADPLAAASNLADVAGLLTCADAVAIGKTLRPAAVGDGNMPWKDLLALLREHEYRGPLVVATRRLPDAAAGAVQAAKLLRADVASAGRAG